MSPADEAAIWSEMIADACRQRDEAQERATLAIRAADKARTDCAAGVAALRKVRASDAARHDQERFAMIERHERMEQAHHDEIDSLKRQLEQAQAFGRLAEGSRSESLQELSSLIARTGRALDPDCDDDERGDVDTLAKERMKERADLMEELADTRDGLERAQAERDSVTVQRDLARAELEQVGRHLGVLQAGWDLPRSVDGPCQVKINVTGSLAVADAIGAGAAMLIGKSGGVFSIPLPWVAGVRPMSPEGDG